MWRQACSIAWKDIRLDLRGLKEIVGLIALGLSCLLIFGLANSGGFHAAKPTESAVYLPYWVTVMFLVLLSTLWAFEREKENGTISALLLACRESSSIFLGKFLAYVFRHFVIQSVLMLIFLILHNRMALETVGWFALTNALTSIGFTALGVVIAAMMSGSGVAGTLGGVLMFPLLIPMVLASVGAMEGVAEGAESDVSNWLQLLAAGDVLFVALPVAFFDMIVEN